MTTCSPTIIFANIPLSFFRPMKSEHCSQESQPFCSSPQGFAPSPIPSLSLSLSLFLFLSGGREKDRKEGWCPGEGSFYLSLLWSVARARGEMRRLSCRNAEIDFEKSRWGIRQARRTRRRNFLRLSSNFAPPPRNPHLRPILHEGIGLYCVQWRYVDVGLQNR